MGPFGYLSRQIFRDIQETQFSGSKMEVHVHLKNAFQAELETEGSRLATIFGLPPTPQRIVEFFRINLSKFSIPFILIHSN